MANIKLTASKALRYGGKRLNPGDAFEAESSHARLLIAIGKAKEVEAKAAKKPAAKPPAAKPAAPALGALPTVAKAATAPAATPGAVPGMTTRSYKTRDLTPEK